MVVVVGREVACRVLGNAQVQRVRDGGVSVLSKPSFCFLMNLNPLFTAPV